MVGSGKNTFSTCWQYMIWRYQNNLGHIMTWYNSNIFVKFVDFSCIISWAENVLILQDENLSKPLDQNVLILLGSTTCYGNIRTFWPRKLCMKTWYSSKSLWFFSTFLVWFFESKMSWYPQIIYYFGRH